MQKLQDALVALATNARLRERFDLDAFDLDPAERATLAAIDRAKLERYARGLVHKRWSDVARVIPLSLRVARSIERRYIAWALDHPAPAIDTTLSPAAAEAYRALPALRRQLAADEREASYAADLLAFEVFSRIGKQFASRFPLDRLVAELRTGALPIDEWPR